jgi:two-component system nitrogen regulation sensor histidine kinase GlnL
MSSLLDGLNRHSTMILDSLSTAVLLFDAELRLRYINSAGENLLAVSANTVLGGAAGELLPCLTDAVDDRMREAIHTRQPFTEREVEVKRPDRQIIRVNCTILPLLAEEAPFDLLMELQQVDRQLRIAREEYLISQHQATQALLRGLAHEIKNPLGGLRGAAQLLERELPNLDLREYTRIIIDEADRLQTLLNRMLGPNQMPQRGWVNVHHITEHVLGLLGAEYPAGPTLLRDYDPSIPDLYGDSDRLIQAILNITRNAAHAAGQNGQVMLRTRVHRQFTIGSIRHRLVLRVDIEDNGPGIPEDLLPRIFFPMISGRSGGTGLGLAIAQELINQHSGLIECESRPGCTIFTVYLPFEGSDE